MALAALVPVVGAIGYTAGHVTRRTQVDGLVTKHATATQVGALFHMGTDGTGRAEYTAMTCAGNVCAWDYRGGTKPHRWRVTLQLEESQALPQQFPHLADSRQ